MSIQPLPLDVRQKIQSSIRLTSLIDVVDELVRNCLDAGAGNVSIAVDFARGYCSVKDDGCGIPAEEFVVSGNLGRTHCTSKIDHPNAYGRHGCFLSHLSAISLTIISSRDVNTSKTSSIVLGKASVLSRTPAQGDTDLQSRGTTVVVRNLFGCLPVRFKSFALRYGRVEIVNHDFDLLKRRLVGYILASAQTFNIRLQTADGRLKYRHRCTQVTSLNSSFDRAKIYSTVNQASLASVANVDLWKLVSAKAAGLYIRAALCLRPSPTKHCQFVALDRQPVWDSENGSILYSLVNDVFDNSAFGCAEGGSGAGERPATRLVSDCRQSSLRGKAVKGVDRWPCFFIKIVDATTAKGSYERQEPPMNNISIMQPILNLLETLLVQFLQAQNLRPKGRTASNRRRFSAPPQPDAGNRSPNFLGHWRQTKSHAVRDRDVQEGLPFTKDIHSPPTDPVLNADVRLLLQDLEAEVEDFLTTNTSDDQTLTHIQQASESPEQPQDIEISSCVDPRTGEMMQINMANGFFITDVLSHEDLAMTLESDSSLGCSLKHATVKLPRRLRLDQDSRDQLAKRLENWPMAGYRTTQEADIRSCCLMNHDGTAESVNEFQATCDTRIDTGQLAKATVLGQVDTKFVLVLLPSEDLTNLVLIDQHAADERVKVEALYTQLVAREAAQLNIPIKFDLVKGEIERFQLRKQLFASWSINYEIGFSAEGATITVSRLPAIIAERCRVEPKLLIELLRQEIWSAELPSKNIGTSEAMHSKLSSCPQGLLDMVNSRACRTAIMFNDHLTKEQCAELLQRLSKCALPFQCAHGRPSMTILGTIERLGTSFGDDDSGAFGNAYTAWLDQDTT